MYAPITGQLLIRPVTLVDFDGNQKHTLEVVGVVTAPELSLSGYSIFETLMAVNISRNGTFIASMFTPLKQDRVPFPHAEVGMINDMTRHDNVGHYEPLEGALLYMLPSGLSNTRIVYGLWDPKNFPHKVAPGDVILARLEKGKVVDVDPASNGLLHAALSRPNSTTRITMSIPIWPIEGEMYGLAGVNADQALRDAEGLERVFNILKKHEMTDEDRAAIAAKAPILLDERAAAQFFKMLVNNPQMMDPMFIIPVSMVRKVIEYAPV